MQYDSQGFTCELTRVGLLWHRPGPEHSDTFLLKAAACAMAPSREATASRAGPNPHSSRLDFSVQLSHSSHLAQATLFDMDSPQEEKTQLSFFFDTCQPCEFKTQGISAEHLFSWLATKSFLHYLALHSMAIKDVQPSIKDDRCVLALLGFIGWLEEACCSHCFGFSR